MRFATSHRTQGSPLWPFIVLVAIILGVRLPLAPQSRVPPAIRDLQKHILKNDYPELFGDNHYRVRIENVLQVDVDNDGRDELLVHFFPHYRQSATVVFYKLTPLEIKRVTEGLAPGPLQEISGEYLDSHETGAAVDFSLEGDQDASALRSKALDSALANFGGVVAYRGFYHANSRKGPAYYLDMTAAELSPGTKTCESFEFSRARQVAAGYLREDSTRNYVAAWVGDKIYVYLIQGISEQGMLDKKI